MAEKEKKNKTRKVVLAGLFGVFLLLVAFYQPILFGLIRIAASQGAKSQAIDLSFDIHGSIFTDLFIENLHLQPRPENHVLPLERLDARRIGLRYDLLALWKKKYLSVVDLVE